MEMIDLADLFTIFLFSLLLLFVLFGYLVIHKAYKIRFKRRVSFSKEKYRLPLYHFLSEGTVSKVIIPHSRFSLIAASELLNEYSQVLEGEKVRNRMRAYAEKHLSSWILKQLHSRRWSLRMNSLYMIEDLRLNFTQEIEKHYLSRRLTAAEEVLLLKISADRNDPQLLEKLQHPKYQLSDFSYLSIFEHLQEDQFSVFAERFDALPLQLKCVVLEVIGQRQLFDYHGLLVNMLNSEESELRVRALKSIGETGLLVEEEKLLPFFSSAMWLERLMAAKVVNSLKLISFSDVLADLMSDEEYLVRSEAAGALSRFHGGTDILRRVAENSQDPFARDMAAEWLKKERMDYAD
ncbi:hypothetical protein GJU40_13280 [Bacillus lacus]|uniref:HEAT repeat domain-containing protein n=1 Tax=Metabacillus lacus TaxID=1983721 RepID=A0A7X2LY10_9BACI|nr:HEAT repeat domain-containing protein [Metabacillus lacus]MRX73115.1 hypothetical protein [Metabacillus lacus]